MTGCPQKVNGNMGYVACGTTSITTHHSATALPPPPTMQVECFFFLLMWHQKTTTTQTPPKAAIFCPSHTHIAENTVKPQQWTTVNYCWANVYASNECMLVPSG